jgi:hypothetical protein
VASASAALVWSAHPDWTANQVLSALIDTAGRDWPKKTPSKYLGYGLLRPRLVLADADYKPTAPDADPLHRENAKGKDVAASSSPSPSSQEKGAAGPAAAPGHEDATTTEAAGDGNGLLWPVVGGVAAVVVIGGVTVVALRKRRTA